MFLTLSYAAAAGFLLTGYFNQSALVPIKVK
jgi:hypothetical protein